MKVKELFEDYSIEMQKLRDARNEKDRYERLFKKKGQEKDNEQNPQKKEQLVAEYGKMLIHLRELRNKKDKLESQVNKIRGVKKPHRFGSLGGFKWPQCKKDSEL
jgi:flagellar biosynthesis component FlhA